MAIPHFINDDRSEMRGIKPGWYAVDDDGNLASGPFSSRDQCLIGSHAANGQFDPVDVVPAPEMRAHFARQICRRRSKPGAGRFGTLRYCSLRLGTPFIDGWERSLRLVSRPNL